MAGAHAVQLVSALLKRGPSHLATLRQELAQWLEEHEYDSLRQTQGSMNLEACPDPQVYSAPTTCWSCRAGGIVTDAIFGAPDRRAPNVLDLTDSS